MTVKEVMDYFGAFYADFESERAYKMLESLQIDPKARLKTMSKGTKERSKIFSISEIRWVEIKTEASGS